MTMVVMMMTLSATGEVSLYSEIGNEVLLDGSISNIIAQHPIGGVKGK